MSSNQTRVAGQAQYVDGSRLRGHARSCLVCIKDKKGGIERRSRQRRGEDRVRGESESIMIRPSTEGLRDNMLGRRSHMTQCQLNHVLI